MTRHYLNAGQIAALIGVSTSALGAHARAGELPDPDAYVGSTPGWTNRLVEQYVGVAWVGRKHVAALPDPLPPWWQCARPVYYLCGVEVAGVLGITPGSVASYRWRNGLFVPYRAVIGRRTYGWDHDEVIEWGAANQYLDADGALLPRREHYRRKWLPTGR